MGSKDPGIQAKQRQDSVITFEKRKFKLMGSRVPGIKGSRDPGIQGSRDPSKTNTR